MADKQYLRQTLEVNELIALPLEDLGYTMGAGSDGNRGKNGLRGTQPPGDSGLCEFGIARIVAVRESSRLALSA